MPPSSGFEVLAQYIANLIDEMGSLKKEVTDLKSQNCSQDIREMKEELRDIKISLQTPTNGTSADVNSYAPQVTNEISETFASVVSNRGHGAEASTSTTSSGLPPVSRSSNLTLAQKLSVRPKVPPSRNAMLPPHQRSSSSTGSSRNDRTAHQPRRVNNASSVLTGRKKFENSRFKGVELRRDLYVGRCNVSVVPDDITGHVSDEFGVEAIACSCISRDDADIKAFKLTVKASDLEVMLDSNRWPADIRIRKYHFKPNRNNGQ